MTRLGRSPGVSASPCIAPDGLHEGKGEKAKGVEYEDRDERSFLTRAGGAAGRHCVELHQALLRGGLGAWISGSLLCGLVLLGLHVLLVLYTGGYRFAVGPAVIEGRRVSAPLLLFLLVALMLVGVEALRAGRIGRCQYCVAFAVILGVYLANGETLGSGDTLPARHLPLSILRDGDFYLDEVAQFFKVPALHSLNVVGSGRRDRPATEDAVAERRSAREAVVSAYPVGAALAALPFYLPSAAGGVAAGNPVVAELEKLSASVLVALSGVLLYSICVRLTTAPMAVLIAGVYAFGTSSLSVSAQALWQHGPSQLASTAALYCLVRAREHPCWAAVAGFPLAFSVLCRPTDVLLALTLALYVLRFHRGQFFAFLYAAAPPLLFQLWYNVRYFGDPLHMQFAVGNGGRCWTAPLMDGLAGLLLSPGRGLLVYSPILLLSIVGVALSWRRGGEPIVRYSSIGVLLVILVHARWRVWWGGLCYGPRLLADVTPFLCLALCPLSRSLSRSRLLRYTTGVLCVASIYAHAIGAFWDDGRWNGYAAPEGLWEWTDNPLVNPPRELLNRLVISIQKLPTSRTAPGLLSASYTCAPRSVGAAESEALTLQVKATNTGGAVWLVWPKREEGSVMLEWTLSAADTAVIGRGKVPLRHDVFEGESYLLPVSLIAPRLVGEYTLAMGLVRNGGPSFEDLGAPPVVVVLQVAGRRP